MSFSMTKPQLLDGSKDVTRRLGWKTLRVGERVTAVEKCMGLRAGERQVVLGEIEVLEVCREPLDAITTEEVEREGYPGKSPAWFVARFTKAMRCTSRTTVTRIVFRKLEEA